MDFGAFVEIFAGTDGLVHVSELAKERVRNVTDVLNEGDSVRVKCIGVDRQGKIKLSRKEAMADDEKNNA
jgi:polyribonucleotide nucleotidyltransferase